MRDVNELHRQAMDLIDEAHLAKMRGAYERYLKLTTQAFALESEAAWAMAGELDLEPTRSVLFRSAAS